MSEQGKPRVLVLASTYPRWDDDPEPAFVHELCRRLAATCSVTALVPDALGANPNGLMDGVSVVRFRYAPKRWQTLVNDGGIAANLRNSPRKWLLVPGFVFFQFIWAWRLLRSREFDVIHAHWLIPQGVVAWLLKRLHRLPYVVTSHGGDLFGFRGAVPTAIKRRVAADSFEMTVMSDAMLQEARRIGLQAPRISVMSMGVDLVGRFVPDESVQRDAEMLLFVGRLVPKKGLSHLLDALPEVLSRRPGVRLLVAGFGPEECALKAQVERLGLAAHVEFMGATPQHELPQLYRRAGLFVAPFVRDQTGDQEGLPVALMEAIGCACPILIGDVRGVRDLLGDAAELVTVRPSDTKNLARSIVASLDELPKMQSLSSGIRADVIRRADWSATADSYAELLKRCATNASPPKSAEDEQ